MCAERGGEGAVGSRKIGEKRTSELRFKLLTYRFTHILTGTTGTSETTLDIPIEARGLKGRTLELFLPFLYVTPTTFREPLVRFALKDREWRTDEKFSSCNPGVFSALLTV